ncbi:MAG: NAD-dependent epimerase/dehydratase family protein [Myxococcales bacterium]|nr:NAD-dependent epimerase/dehydratase family protein [Myxococcales bacterium]
MADAPIALITGISGALAQLVGKALVDRGIAVVGVDYRHLPDAVGYPAVLLRANYNKTKIEDVFRRHRPTYVLHLGRVGNLKERMNKRFDLNVMGSRKVMDLALKYGARRMLVLSTFHIYGAHPHNHTPIYEDEPLRAGTAFPQIADAIQLDSQALTWAYQHDEVKTMILRPTNVIGPDISNAMSKFLRQKTVPTVIGFDPMVQFVHQTDLVEAIVRSTCDSQAVGVFNVAGRGTIPVRRALDLVPGRKLPLPSSLVMSLLRAGSLVMRTLPPYLVNFFKYPCVISDQKLRTTLSWEPAIGQTEAIRSTVGVA